MYSVATGSNTRMNRRTDCVAIIEGLVCQTSRWNGGTLRRPPKRSRSDRRSVWTTRSAALAFGAQAPIE
jgi:hypothetical protein